ncbi:hypothetical protein ACFLU6_06345 [Acidobacteriota bacterium]
MIQNIHPDRWKTKSPLFLFALTLGIMIGCDYPDSEKKAHTHSFVLSLCVKLTTELDKGEKRPVKENVDGWFIYRGKDCIRLIERMGVTGVDAAIMIEYTKDECRDPWGNDFVVAIKELEKNLWLVIAISRGKDGELNTEDDIIGPNLEKLPGDLRRILRKKRY